MTIDINIANNAIPKRGVLDKIPGSFANYGLSKFRRGYAGPCFRGRRSSDNTEQDFGFVGVDDTLITLVNKLGRYGNFEWDADTDGLADGWAVSAGMSAVSVANNEQICIATALNGRIEYLCTEIPVGHIIYTCAYMKTISTTPKIYIALGNGQYSPSGGAHSANDVYEFFSTIGTVQAQTALVPKVYVQDSASSDWQQIQLKKFHLLDLTEIFGAGNEPSKQILDPIMQNLIDSQGYLHGNGLVNTQGYLQEYYSDALDKQLYNRLGSLGDFLYDADGDGLADGWSADSVLASHSIENGIQTFLPGAGYAGIKFLNLPKPAVGHKIVLLFEIDTGGQEAFAWMGDADMSPMVFTGPQSQPGEFVFQRLYLTIQSGMTTLEAHIACNVASGFVPFRLKKVHFFDLTEIYGAGSEPSDAQIISIFQPILSVIPASDSKPRLDVCIPNRFSSGLAKSRVCNALTNGNFEFGPSGWVGSGAYLSKDSEGLVAIGSGSTSVLVTTQTTGIHWVQGRKVYVKYTAKVKDAVCQSIKAKLSGSDGGTSHDGIAMQASPLQNTWYTKSAIVTLGDASVGTGSVLFKVYMQYADAATANGKIAKYNDLVFVDMGIDSSNPYYDKSLAEMDALVGNYVNPYGFEAGEANLRAALQFVYPAGSLNVTTWHDQSGKANHATQVAASAQPRIIGAGIMDNGLLFYGNDFLIPVNANNSMDILNAPLSIFVNFCPTLAQTGYIFVKNFEASSDVQYGCWFHVDLKVSAYLSGVTNSTGSVFPIDTPYKYAYAWNGSNIRHYKNAVFLNQNTASPTLTSQPNVTIGARGNTGGGRTLFFNGYLTSLALFTSVLSEGQLNLLQRSVI